MNNLCASLFVSPGSASVLARTINTVLRLIETDPKILMGGTTER